MLLAICEEPRKHFHDTSVSLISCKCMVQGMLLEKPDLKPEGKKRVESRDKDSPVKLNREENTEGSGCTHHVSAHH